MVVADFSCCRWASSGNLILAAQPVGERSYDVVCEPANRTYIECIDIINPSRFYINDHLVIVGRWRCDIGWTDLIQVLNLGQ